MAAVYCLLLMSVENAAKAVSVAGKSLKQESASMSASLSPMSLRRSVKTVFGSTLTALLAGAAHVQHKRARAMKMQRRSMTSKVLSSGKGFSL